MYAKVDKVHYQKVTGNARAAILTGRFTASVIAQLLVSLNVMDIRELNFLTLGAQTVSLIVAIALPSVGISLYFYSLPDSFESVTESTDQAKDENIPKHAQVNPIFSYSRATGLLWRHFLDSYSNWIIVQWSFWWALAMAGFMMVQFYVQFLWQEVDPDREYLLNAGVEATLTLFGATAAFGAGYLTSKKFQKYDSWILTVCSLVEGVFVIISSQTNSIWLAYIMYILFGILYSFMITIASATVAQQLADDSFALIFGINTLVAFIFQSILTVVVIQWLEMSIRNQFLVYGIYFVVLSVIYLITSVAKLFLCRKPST